MTTVTATTAVAADTDPDPGPGPVQRAAALRDLLTRHRAEGDRSRCLTDETISALIDAGQFRTLVPRRYGGLEAGLRTVVDATAEVAAGDPAAGWVVMILGCADWLVGLFPDAAQDEVYGDGPDARVCAVFAPSSVSERVSGGWMVGGRWGPSSGCRHAQWAILGVPLAGFDGEPEGHALALIPTDQLIVTATWHTLGMRGTASDTLSGSELFVPGHRVLRLAPAIRGDYPTSHSGLPRYRSALVPTLVTHMIAPFLGIATAALELVIEQAPHRPVTFTDYTRQTDSTAFQLAVADAATRIDVARALAHRAADEVDGHAHAGTYPDPLTRARIRGWAGHAVAQCRDAVDTLVSAYGASAFGDAHPLNGLVRDIHTAAGHAMANPVSNAEIYGKALLDVTPNISAFI